jgi:hypothetical protein
MALVRDQRHFHACADEEAARVNRLPRGFIPAVD